MNHTSKLPAAANSSTRQAIQALLQNNGNPINFTLYGCLIQRCTDRVLLRQEKNVCRGLAHVEPDAFTLSCVLKAMSEVVADEPFLARMIHCYVMKKGFCSDVFVGYSQGGFYKECKDLYKVMLDSEELKPDAITVICTLHACAQSNDLIFGMEVHRYMIDKRIEMNLSVCNAIIAVFAKCGSLDYAK